MKLGIVQVAVVWIVLGMVDFVGGLSIGVKV